MERIALDKRPEAAVASFGKNNVHNSGKVHNVRNVPVSLERAFLSVSLGFSLVLSPSLNVAFLDYLGKPEAV